MRFAAPLLETSLLETSNRTLLEVLSVCELLCSSSVCGVLQDCGNALLGSSIVK
jgi:hypothetical protein